MSDVVEAITEIPADDVASGEFVAESFEFRKVKGTWRWTAAFTTAPTVYPAADSSDVPRASPMRKLLVDTVAQEMSLRRPLTIKHLRTSGRVAYIEAQEPGTAGRYARAFLRRLPDNAKGRTLFRVEASSFRPASGDDSEWQAKTAALRRAGAPDSLFPVQTATQEGDGHAR